MKYFIAVMLVFTTSQVFAKDRKLECAGLNHPAHQDEYELCLKAGIDSTSGVDCVECMISTKEMDCSGLDHPLYKDEHKACLQINKVISKNKEKQVPAEFRIAYKNSVRCDEVNDQYVLCNGVRYVRDIKNNDSLKRNIKEIEEFIDSGLKETVTGPATKGTSR